MILRVALQILQQGVPSGQTPEHPEHPDLFHVLLYKFQFGFALYIFAQGVSSGQIPERPERPDLFNVLVYIFDFAFCFITHPTGGTFRPTS